MGEYAKPKRKTLSTIAGGGITAALAAAAIVAGGTIPGAAEAAPQSSSTASRSVHTTKVQRLRFHDAARIRTGPNTNRTVVGVGAAGDYAISDRIGTGKPIKCVRGIAANNGWFHLRDTRTGVTGWVSFCYMRFVNP